MVEIIAELGQTMEGDIDKAIEGVHAFADAGATGIKVQWLQPELLASDHAHRYWETNEATSQKHAFEKAGMIPYDKWTPVIAACVNGGVEFITTPFDLDAVREWSRYREDWPALRTLKVASGDITNHMLLDAVGEVADRVILSTGGATLGEIGAAVDVLIGTHKESAMAAYHRGPYPRCEVVLLACSLEYPTPPERANLGRIRTLLNVPPLCGPAGTKFPVGYSDHTEGWWAGDAAVYAGATVLEKHVTLGGDPNKVADHAMGASVETFRRYTEAARVAERCLGDGVMGVHEGEAAAVQGARRGLYASDAIKEGELLSKENVHALRPAPTTDVHAGGEHWFQLEGQPSNRQYDRGEMIER